MDKKQKCEMTFEDGTLIEVKKRTLKKCWNSRVGKVELHIEQKKKTIREKCAEMV